LLRAHAQGDRDAFATLFHRHRDRLWSVAIRTVGDREEAADALQDALLSAHRSAARFRGESAVTTWLHRIVVNACLDRLRRRQAHPTVPLADGNRSSESDRWAGAFEPVAPDPDRDTALVIRQALAALPIDQRAAIVLVDVQGYPVAEVATILGVPEGTVKSRCARGRARLAGMLGDLRPAGTSGPRAGMRPVTTGNQTAGSNVPSEAGSPGAAGPQARAEAVPHGDAPVGDQEEQ